MSAAPHLAPQPGWNPRHSVRVTCYFPGDSADAALWVQDLRRALPGAAVDIWQPGQAPADHAVVWQPTQQFFDAQPALRGVFNAGAGVDAITGFQLPPHAVLVRLEDAGMAEQMADYVTHAVLHHMRDFGAYAAQQAARQWLQQAPRDKADFPVGILGAGVLGQAVAAQLSALGFGVQCWARTARSADPGARPAVGGPRVVAGAAALGALLPASRVLVCLLPLTPETRGILGGATFAQLQHGAYLINVARGGHLIVADLLQALGDGQLAGATLDVFDDEPLAPDSPLWLHPAIRITPHIAAATLRRQAVAQIAAKLVDLQRGLTVSGTVAKGCGY